MRRIRLTKSAIDTLPTRPPPIVTYKTKLVSTDCIAMTKAPGKKASVGPVKDAVS